MKIRELDDIDFPEWAGQNAELCGLASSLKPTLNTPLRRSRIHGKARAAQPS